MIVRLSLTTSALLGMASLAAAAQTPTPSEMADVMWEQVHQVCPDEADRFTVLFPDSLQSIFRERWSASIDEGQEVYWPMTDENMQIVSYVVVQAAQVTAMMTYESELRKSFEEGGVVPQVAFDNARASTALANCLMPVGDRFALSTEEAIPQLAAAVTKDVICAKWLEYSDSVLNLPVDNMTQSEYTDAWRAIGLETIESCEEQS